MRWTPQWTLPNLYNLWDYNSKLPHLSLGGMAANIANSSSNLEDNLSTFVDVATRSFERTLRAIVTELTTSEALDL